MNTRQFELVPESQFAGAFGQTDLHYPVPAVDHGGHRSECDSNGLEAIVPLRFSQRRSTQFVILGRAPRWPPLSQRGSLLPRHGSRRRGYRAGRTAPRPRNAAPGVRKPNCALCNRRSTLTSSSTRSIRSTAPSLANSPDPAAPSLTWPTSSATSCSRTRLSSLSRKS